MHERDGVPIQLSFYKGLERCEHRVTADLSLIPAPQEESLSEIQEYVPNAPKCGPSSQEKKKTTRWQAASGSQALVTLF